MRPMSPATRALVEQLPVRPPANGGAAVVDLVRRLGEQREVGALAHLIVLLPSDGALADATSQAIAQIVAAQPMKVYPELESLRSRGWVVGELGKWWSLEPSDVARLAQLSHGWAALAMASLHRSGFVRESAVRALGERMHDGGIEIPFLLLRLNDWVPEVRRAATAALAARIQSAFADALWRALPLVVRLRAQRRADHGGIIRWIELLLRDPDTRPALARAMASPDRYVRRQAAEVALGSDELDAQVLVRALTDEDGIVRMLGAQRIARLEGQARATALARALEDPTAAVRRLALDMLDGDPATQRRALEARLGDRQRHLRELARARLHALDERFDFAAHYRRLIATPLSAPRLRAVVAGLGECGVDEDVLALEPFAADGRAKVRSVVLQAMAALDEESVGFLVDALTDPSRRVSRAAARILQKRARAGLHDLLVAVVEADVVPAHARGYAMDVVCAASPWTRLVRLLELTRSRNQQAAELARERIRPRTSVEPMPSEFAVLDRARDQSALTAEEQ